MMRQHTLPSTTPHSRATKDHAAIHAEHMQDAKMIQLQSRWKNLTRNCAGWAVRKDKLRPLEAQTFNSAKIELAKVEADMDAIRQARAGRAVEAPAPAAPPAPAPDIDPLAKPLERGAAVEDAGS